jgi:hypothetical protein
VEQAPLLVQDVAIPSKARREVFDITASAAARLAVGWSDGADRASNDADVSIALPEIPYGGVPQYGLKGSLWGRACRVDVHG